MPVLAHTAAQASMSIWTPVELTAILDAPPHGVSCTQPPPPRVSLANTELQALSTSCTEPATAIWLMEPGSDSCTQLPLARSSLAKTAESPRRKSWREGAPPGGSWLPEAEGE